MLCVKVLFDCVFHNLTFLYEVATSGLQRIWNQSRRHRMRCWESRRTRFRRFRQGSLGLLRRERSCCIKVLSAFRRNSRTVPWVEKVRNCKIHSIWIRTDDAYLVGEIYFVVGFLAVNELLPTDLGNCMLIRKSWVEFIWRKLRISKSRKKP